MNRFQPNLTFALSAFANHLSLLAEKYWNLLKNEGGIELLHDILKSNTATQSMKKYAAMILKKVEEFGKGMS